MFSIKRRFLRGDMIHVFKLSQEADDSTLNELFELRNGQQTRGHCKKIIKKGCRLDLRKSFFSQRVVNLWNSLPNDVIESNSLQTFKHRLDQHMNAVGLI